LQPQYLNARDIETNALTAWYVNHLNRHATHHALMGVPFYNLERAHAYLLEALARESVPVVRARGYVSAVFAANRLARSGAFIEQGQGTP
jgi:fatty acid desaturase